jgi:hypothetical protein
MVQITGVGVNIGSSSTPTGICGVAVVILTCFVVRHLQAAA